MIRITIACASLIVHLGCLYFVRKGFRKATASSPSGAVQERGSVSVIVAARNECRNLPQLLSALERQTHADFECIIVDDASLDGTAELVRTAAGKDRRFKLIAVAEPVQPRKKHALSLGISEASNEIMAFTDADCIPRDTWIETLLNHHGTVPTVVVGFSPFHASGTILNRFVRFETFFTAFLSAGAIGLGRPYMAVGRNFSYSKSVFEKIGGFEYSLHVLSGDDDLLLQQAARLPDVAIRYMAEEAGFVYSTPPPSWRQWLNQKLRHTSAGRYYDRRIQAALAIFHVSNLAVWSTPLYAGWIGVALLVTKLGAGYVLVAPAAKRLRQQPALKGYPLLEGLYVLYNTVVAPLGVLFKPRRW